jgi:hypothetical protein
MCQGAVGVVGVFQNAAHLLPLSLAILAALVDLLQLIQSLRTHDLAALFIILELVVIKLHLAHHSLQLLLLCLSCNCTSRSHDVEMADQ